MAITGDILTETFDATGYDNTGWTATGTVDPNYTGTVLEGTQSLLLTGTSADAHIDRSLTGRSSVYVYFQFRTPNLPSDDLMTLALFDAGPSNYLVRFYIKPSGAIYLLSAASYSGGSSGTLAANTTYHFWVTYIKGSGANGFCNAAFSTDGVRPTSGSNYVEITDSTVTADVAYLQILASHPPSGTWAPIFDRFCLNTTQIGDATAATVTVNLTGVSASPAVGTLTFNGSFTLAGAAATPAIGTGTVTTDTPATVTVTLTGVGATPAIGIGHVAIEGEVIAPPEQGLVAGGGRWYGLPEDEKVYLTGVAANPQVGKIAAKPRGTLDELYRMYPFPRQVEERPLPVVRKKAAKPPKPVAFVYMAGVHPMPKIGNVTTKAFYEDNDEELTSMLKMMDVDDDLITALKLSK